MSSQPLGICDFSVSQSLLSALTVDIDTLINSTGLRPIGKLSPSEVDIEFYGDSPTPSDFLKHCTQWCNQLQSGVYLLNGIGPNYLLARVHRRLE